MENKKCEPYTRHLILDDDKEKFALMKVFYLEFLTFMSTKTCFFDRNEVQEQYLIVLFYNSFANRWQIV